MRKNYSFVIYIENIYYGPKSKKLKIPKIPNWDIFGI